MELISYAEVAWEDRILTESEKQKMFFLLKKIEDDAVTLAKYDEIITTEEENLLNIIKETINNFFEDEQVYTYV